MLRVINVRRKGTNTITEMFKFNGRDPEQVSLLAQFGYICYIGCLLMNVDVSDSAVVTNDDWAFWDGQKVMFVTSANVDQFFEPPLGKYGGDSRTIGQLWRDSNGRT